MVTMPSARVFLVALTTAAIALVVSAFAFNDLHHRPSTSLGDHMRARAKILAEEAAQAVGGSQQLTAVERLANDVIMRAKRAEIAAGFANLSTFNPAHHFFRRKRHIADSEVFNAIRRMPKGAVLHAHDTALIGGDFVLKNITYMPHLYMCLSDNNKLQLFFFKRPPASDGGDCTWQLLADVRANSQDVQEFDKQLGARFTMEVDDPEVQYPDLDAAWSHFAGIFEIITPMLTYKPAWEAFFYEALRQFREDNVFYVEVRTTLPDLYDLDGNPYDHLEAARSYKRINDKFRADYPDSFGARFIYAPLRLVALDEVREYVKTAIRLRDEFGDFFAGFDLVGQEDKGVPLVDFLPALAELPTDIRVFYHAGETNWCGTSSDENLVDAVLLGASRIGHGYALLKHPVVAKMVVEAGIAIEVNPLSNQVLKLVDDLRNHPGAEMLAAGYPVVVSSDDPGLWGGLPISHDLYAAFVGMANVEADIAMLKDLALNTIKYSAMPSTERYFAVSRFVAQWNAFVLGEAKRHTDPQALYKILKPDTS